MRANVAASVAMVVAFSLAACSATQLTAGSPESTPPVSAPTASSQPQNIHVLEQVDNDTEVKVGSLTGCTNTTSCQGDYSTITLTGRGQIVFTETVDFDHPAGERGPITGGTGEFLGATGVVTSPGLADFVIEITK